MTVQYSLPSQARLDGVMIGTLLALSEDGAPRVSFPGCADAQGLAARGTAALSKADIGAQVAGVEADPVDPIGLRIGHHGEAVTPGFRSGETADFHPGNAFDLRQRKRLTHGLAQVEPATVTDD